MPDKRLVAVVTGLMLVIGALVPGASAATLDQLRTIDTLLTRNDTRGLWAYLQQHPDLMIGQDELAVELRKFHDDVSLGRLRGHYVAPAAPRPAPAQTVTVVSRNAVSDPGIY